MPVGTRWGRRRYLLITIIVLLVTAGVLVAVFRAIDSNALVVTGGGELTGPGTQRQPLTGSMAEVTNQAPWPVELTGGFAETPVRVAFSKPEAGFEESGEWLEAGDSLTLPSGASVMLWTSIAATADVPVGFYEIHLTYLGLFDVEHEAKVENIGMIATPEAVPGEVVAFDDSSDSLGSYIGALNTALANDDLATLAKLMGASATAADAADFREAQAGVEPDMGWSAAGHIVAFFRSSTEDSLPEFEVTWSNYRWSVVR